MANNLTSEYSDTHIATSSSNSWTINTGFDNSQYVNFEFWNGEDNWVQFPVYQVFKRGTDADGFYTYNTLDEYDQYEHQSTNWDPTTGILVITYSVLDSSDYQLRTSYRYSSPHQPVKFKVTSDSQSPGKKVSVPPGAKLIIYNTPQPPAPPT